MRIALIFSVFLFFLCSCVVQFAAGNEYARLPVEEQSKIMKLSSFASVDNSFIYEINGLQLRSELAKHQKSIVYTFTSNCSSDYCVPLSVIENYAAENNYKLFLVISSYYKLELIKAQNFKNQLFGVDADYYGERKTRNYMKAFNTDLGYYNLAGSSNYVGNILFFDRDSLVAIKRSILE